VFRSTEELALLTKGNVNIMTARNILRAALGGLLTMAIGIALAPTAAHAARRASASKSVDPLIAYYDVGENGGVGDNEVRIVNPTKANGNLCAMIYVFDDDQELGECCGCPLSPNKLLPMSVNNDLTSNWALSVHDTGSGTLVIVPTTSNVASCTNGACNSLGTTFCDPTQGYTETPTLNAWITHAEAVVGGGSAAPTIAGTSVEEFATDATDTAEQAFLISTCSGIISNGSGSGSCDCGPEKE